MDKKIVRQTYVFGSYRNPQYIEEKDMHKKEDKASAIISNKTLIKSNVENDKDKIIDNKENKLELSKKNNKSELEIKQYDIEGNRISNKNEDNDFHNTAKIEELNAKEKSIPKNASKGKGIWDKIKKIKHFEIYIALVFVIIVFIIYFSSNPFSSTPKENESDYKYQTANDYCIETEARLSQLLSSIENAGKVKVMITFESTPERVIAYIVNSTKNTSANGDGSYNENTQNSSSPQIIYVSGDQIPLILKEVTPNVLGVLVVAQGADEIKVRLDIINAVSVLLNISADKIKVLTMNKG